MSDDGIQNQGVHNINRKQKSFIGSGKVDKIRSDIGNISNYIRDENGNTWSKRIIVYSVSPHPSCLYSTVNS